MPRSPRVDVGENYYHVINRANARLQIFFTEEDYKLFESVLEDACEMFSVDLIAYCVMPNHFHLILKTGNDGELSFFMKWFTQTHTKRWHSYNKTHGSGSLYQGRYKSFIIQEDRHLLTVLRYVERNPLTANLVKNSLNWKYSSLYRREMGDAKARKLLSEWPIERPADYLILLETPIGEKEIAKLEQSENRCTPYGDDAYVLEMVEKYGLEQTIRGKGRPKKAIL
jgi:putative transposase